MKPIEKIYEFFEESVCEASIVAENVIRVRIPNNRHYIFPALGILPRYGFNLYLIDFQMQYTDLLISVDMDLFNYRCL